MSQNPVKTLNLEYFASIASKTNTSQERYSTESNTIAELWQELQTRYQFDIGTNCLRAAKNHRFCDWNSPIDNQDTIAFIPPVSGG